VEKVAKWPKNRPANQLSNLELRCARFFLREGPFTICEETKKCLRRLYLLHTICPRYKQRNLSVAVSQESPHRGDGRFLSRGEC